jgi:uncharacterized membrane protein
MSLILVGFYMIVGAGWRPLTLCLLGFLLARITVTRLAHPARKNQHAP